MNNIIMEGVKEREKIHRDGKNNGKETNKYEIGVLKERMSDALKDR